MKVYRVVVNSDTVLVTDSRLRALERLYTGMQKIDQARDWGWIEEDEVK